MKAVSGENNKTITTKVDTRNNLTMKFPNVDELMSLLEAPIDSL